MHNTDCSNGIRTRIDTTAQPKVPKNTKTPAARERKDDRTRKSFSTVITLQYERRGAFPTTPISIRPQLQVIYQKKHKTSANQKKATRKMWTVRN